jgi:hypothetical protein
MKENERLEKISLFLYLKERKILYELSVCFGFFICYTTKKKEAAYTKKIG